MDFPPTGVCANCDMAITEEHLKLAERRKDIFYYWELALFCNEQCLCSWCAQKIVSG